MKLILSDADEVLLCWADAFKIWLKDVKQHDIDAVEQHARMEDWLSITSEQKKSLLIEFNTTYEYFGRLEPYHNAKEYVAKLYEHGYKLVVITACPDDDKTRLARQNNLELHFGPAIGDIHCVGVGFSKKEILQKYEPTFWVEDTTRHALVGADLGHKSLLINRRHNIRDELPESIIRVNDWKDIYHIITS
jgi:FMN phosphatase YigB (HAD superfamily)